MNRAHCEVTESLWCWVCTEVIRIIPDPTGLKQRAPSQIRGIDAARQPGVSARGKVQVLQ